MKIGNQIKASGRIKQVKITENGAYVSIVSKQGSSASGGLDIFLTFLYKGEDLPSYVKPEARIEVKGFLESFKYKNEQGKWLIGHRMVATEFAKRQTICMEYFGTDGYYFAPPSAQALFAGRIMEVKQDNNWYRLLINTKDENGENDVRLSVPVKQFSEQIRPDTDICCACSITTKKKEKYNKSFIYTDFIITDLAILLGGGGVLTTQAEISCGFEDLQDISTYNKSICNMQVLFYVYRKYHHPKI